MAPESRGETMNPSTPFANKSSAPLFTVAITGTPQAIAWAWTSARPSCTDGTTSTLAWL
jgi:hypothetical protein